MFVKMWDIPFVGKIIKRITVNREGGEKSSKSLREYYRIKYKIFVDLYSYGGCFAKDFNSGGNVRIGKYCSIGQNVHYLAGNHPTNYLSTSPYFYQKAWGGADVKDIVRTDLVIGNDCWIGYGVIITPGCNKIGNGSIIGAGSVVTHDVPEYSICVGNPAHVIRYRFDDDIIDKLISSKWWDNDPEKLLKHYDCIDNISEIIERLEKEKTTV